MCVWLHLCVHQR